MAALLENGQQADGSVRLPAALAPYFGAAAIGPGG
jgi:seryl-tRNA synthetase